QDALHGLGRAEEVFPSEALGRPARSLQRYSPPYHSAVPVGGHQRPAIRCTGFMECRAGDYSALMPANLTTLRHLSVSSAMNFPKSVGEPVNIAAPRSVRRFFMLESTRAALISLLSFSTISVGVALGTTIPYQPLASKPGRNSPTVGTSGKGS